MPYLGLCLGMQIAVIEYARDVLGWADAASGEFDAESAPQGHRLHAGPERRYRQGRHAAPRRLALRREARHNAHAACYGAGEISERHRHRYELNNDFRAELGEPRG